MAQMAALLHDSFCILLSCLDLPEPRSLRLDKRVKFRVLAILLIVDVAVKLLDKHIVFIIE